MKINRRDLLKTGIISIGSVAPWLRAGAFGSEPPLLDSAGRIYYSPLVREYFPEEISSIKPMIQIGFNENPYGPSPATREAIDRAVKNREGNRYTWREVTELAGMIAEKERVAKDSIMMGPGSSDLLERTALAVCTKGGNVISADPTFMSLIRVAGSTGASWKAIPCKSDWSHDLDAMEKAVDKNTRLVYVCNPSNPIGAVTDSAALMDFCKRVSEKVPVFVDEAYMEFAQGATETMVPLLSQGRNVIVARTFSKVMGLAGLRVGYLVALPSTLDRITSGATGISITTVRAAVAALQDIDFQKMTLGKNEEVKNYLCINLKELGYQYIPSHTNFVIFPIRMGGKEFLNKMGEKGILVRSFDIQSKPWCRVSIGTMDEIRQFVSVLKDIG